MRPHPHPSCRATRPDAPRLNLHDKPRRRPGNGQGRNLFQGTASAKCVFCLRGLNRSAAGKTQVSFTSRRPQQLAPSTLTSLLACTNALRRAILRHGYAWRQPRSDSSLRGRPALFPERRPLPTYSISIKAKAVPVVASSSEIASARPTGPELRPRSFTALQIQHSSNDALDYQAVPKPIGFGDGQTCRPGSEKAE